MDGNKKTFVLDGGEMKTVKGAHAYIAEKLDFPDYYGKNLDALADCLGELPRGVEIVLVNTDALKWNLGAYAKRLTEVFEELSEPANAFSFRIER